METKCFSYRNRTALPFLGGNETVVSLASQMREREIEALALSSSSAAAHSTPLRWVAPTAPFILATFPFTSLPRPFVPSVPYRDAVLYKHTARWRSEREKILALWFAFLGGSVRPFGYRFLPYSRGNGGKPDYADVSLGAASSFLRRWTVPRARLYGTKGSEHA